jgi:NTE family protein
MPDSYLDVKSLVAGRPDADLAKDAAALVVIEPLPHMRDGGGDVRIVPDERALEAFGPNVGDRSRWSPVYREGVRQAPEAAERIAAAPRRPLIGTPVSRYQDR